MSERAERKSSRVRQSATRKSSSQRKTKSHSSNRGKSASRKSTAQARPDEKRGPSPANGIADATSLKPELYFGLIGPAGCDLSSVERELGSSLRRFGYEAEVVKISSRFRLDFRNPPWGDLPADAPEDERYRRYQDAGDELRGLVRRLDVGALLAVRDIRRKRSAILQRRTAERRDLPGLPDELPDVPVAYVIHSLKTPEEVRRLRSIYGSRFVAVGAFTSRSDRRRNLARKIARSRHQNKADRFRAKAEEIIFRDELGKEENPFGQNVSETFPLSDVVLDASARDSIRSGVKRLLDLFFGYQYLTPSRDEHALFHAFASATRSASMARQVGAAIANENGDIVSVGCNEAPSPYGGLYWEGDDPDGRDFQHGHDLSDVMRKNVLADTLERLVTAGWVPPGADPRHLDDENKRRAIVARQLEALQDEEAGPTTRSLRRGLLVQDLIEFTRGVHAEMAAIASAVSRGVPVRDCTLYCTTFPCHECARGIVAAGIRRVVYLQPYPKSLVSDFYSDSINVDGEGEARGVAFESFVGIGPERFMNLFEMLPRKDNEGATLPWDEATAVPRTDIFGIPYGESAFETVARRVELEGSLLKENSAVAEALRAFEQVGLEISQ